MPTLLVAGQSTAGRYRDEVLTALKRAGFSCISCLIENAVSTVETVAMSGGRLDAAVLLEPHFLMEPGPSPALGVIAQMRTVSDLLSFRGAVKARSLPVVAVCQGRLTVSHSWVRLVPPFQLSRFEDDRGPVAPPEIVEHVVEAMREWRADLIRELQYVGYVVTTDSTGKLSVSHALSRLRRESEILTDAATPGALRQNQFLVLADDLLAGFEPYRQLAFLLNQYQAMASAEGKKPETLFQELFDRYPHLIYRQQFDLHWSKPSFRDPIDNKLVQPDYLLRPRMGPHRGSAWQILDLKLPDELLVVNKRRNANFAGRLCNYIEQVRNYRDLLGRADMRSQLEKHFGVHPVNARIALLIGRRRDGDSELLDRLNRPELDVELITYDDIMELEESRLWLDVVLAGVTQS